MGKKFDLKVLANSLNKELKEEVISAGTGYSSGDIKDWIPTGIAPLDAKLGGGLPVGRIVEIYGPESQGKSTLMCHMFAECQKKGGIAVLIDSETSFEKNRAVKLGVDMDKLLIIEAETLERGFTIIHMVIDKLRTHKELDGKPILIAWDTIAGTPTDIEMENRSDPKKNQWAEGRAPKPQIIKKGLNRLNKDLSRHSACLLIVNQVIDNISPYGERELTTGGRGLKHLASLRLRIGKVHDRKTGERKIGIDVCILIKKSKICWPFQKTTVPLYFDSGYDSDLSILFAFDEAENGSPLRKGSGGWYSMKYKGKSVSFQERNFSEKLEEHKGLREFLVEECYRVLSPGWYKEKYYGKLEKKKS